MYRSHFIFVDFSSAYYSSWAAVGVDYIAGSIYTPIINNEAVRPAVCRFLHCTANRPIAYSPFLTYVLCAVCVCATSHATL